MVAMSFTCKDLLISEEKSTNYAAKCFAMHLHRLRAALLKAEIEHGYLSGINTGLSE